MLDGTMTQELIALDIIIIFGVQVVFGALDAMEKYSENFISIRKKIDLIITIPSIVWLL